MTALLLLLLATAGGTVLTLLYDDEAGLFERLSQGALLGVLLFGALGFMLALAVGSLPLGVVVAAGLGAASPLALLARPSVRRRMGSLFRGAVPSRPAGERPSPPPAAVVVSLGLLALLLLHVLGGAMELRVERGSARSPAVFTGVVNNLGDLPLHISIIRGFVDGRNYPPQDPEFAGARLTYPFMADFVAALLVRAGAGLDVALLLENLLLVLATVGLLFFWVRRVTGSGLAALLAPWLLLLNGGLGFVLLGSEAASHSGGLLGLLAHLPHDYTISAEHGLRWGNTLTTLLVPQRSLLLGLPAFIMVIDLWWRAMVQSPQPGSEGRAIRLMAAAGVVTGFLPLGHTYTYLVLAAMAACEAALYFRFRPWAAYAVPAIGLALPQIALLSASSGVHAGGFFAFSPGWDHGSEPIVWFWLKNTGLVWPLLLVGLAWTGRHDGEEAGEQARRGVPETIAPAGPGDLPRFYAPFVLCFVVPNLFRVSPWIWDGIKILVFWFVASVPLLALTVVRIGTGPGWRRVAAGALVVLLTLSGGLDLWRIVSRAGEQRIFDGNAVAFASRAAAVAPPGSVVLHEPAFDSPVYLMGRRSLMGYPGHIWSRGLDPGSRERDVRSMLDGSADAPALLRSYGVRYCIWGPLEQKNHPGGAAYHGRWRPVIEEKGYRLYEIPQEGRTDPK